MVSLPTRGTSWRLTASWDNQPHGPSCPAFGRVASYHGDNALLLTGIEHSRRARALFLTQRRPPIRPSDTDGPHYERLARLAESCWKCVAD
jgi:hypothetical protein